MPPPSRQADCHPERKHEARGMCELCYNIWLEKKNRQKRNTQSRDWYANNKERAKHLWCMRTYKISLEEYNKRKEEQNYKCAICKIGEAIHLDHHHDSGRLRKFLCGNCNRGIGVFKESKEFLNNAIQYLKEHD